jgi:hypothetical protein
MTLSVIVAATAAALSLVIAAAAPKGTQIGFGFKS